MTITFGNFWCLELGCFNCDNCFSVYLVCLLFGNQKNTVKCGGLFKLGLH